MINESTYNLSVWKPFVTGDSYDLSAGGGMSRTIFDIDQTNAYVKSLGASGVEGNNTITSVYLSLRARTTVSENIGAYTEVNYNAWNNHDRFTSESASDLHAPVTLKVGFDYVIVGGAQVGLGAVVGSKFDTEYTASFKYSFK